MIKYLREIVILIVQLFVFYILPLFAGPTDIMGLVLLIIMITFILSIIIGCISKEKIKYFYPIVISIIYIPSVFIYYNESALIHSLWYLIDSYIGLGLGTIIYKLVNKLKIKNNIN